MTDQKEHPIRVLLLSKYPRQGASSRLRFLQFIPGLAAAGIRVDEAPFFSDSYLPEKYSGKRPSIIGVMKSYLRRLKFILRAKRFDVVWVQGEIFPMLPAWAERIMSYLGVRIIVDYDDAIFHRYDRSRNVVIKGLLHKKIAAVMRHATVVTVGNKYLGDYAQRAGADQLVLIPTVVNSSRYFSAKKENAAPVIGWVGTPITAIYIREIARELEQVCLETGARLRLVGAGEDILSAFSTDCVDICEWSEDNECDNLSTIDIGIMPLKSSPWEQGKCGYKLIQYMASGAGVVATHTDANAAIIKRGQCGRIINEHDNWLEALVALLKDRENLALFGQAGRLAVENYYSVQAQLPRIVELMRNTARGQMHAEPEAAQETKCAE